MRLSLLAFFAFSAQAADIAGVVTALSRSVVAPLPGATVSVTSLRASGPSKSAQVTDSGGRFDFADLPDGGYVLAASGAGYQSPDENEIAVWITHGESRTGLEIKLVSQGVLCGTVTDPEGAPLLNAEVRAYALRAQNSERYLARSSLANTDRFGGYCVGGLAAGSYVLGAFRAPASRGAEAAGIGPMEGFYPGATSASAADPVALGWGESLDGIDIRLRPQSHQALRGAVVDSEGRRCRACTLQMYVTDDGFRDILPGSVKATEAGEFEVEGLPPGAYQLIATSAFEKDGFASPELYIGDNDLTGVVFRLKPDCRVTGRLAPETPAAIFDPESIFVSLTPSPPSVVLQRVRSYLDEDLRFSIPCTVNVTYRVEVRNLPAGSYLRTLRMGTTELRAPEMTITTEAPQPLEAVIAFDGAVVEGTVKARGKRPAERLLVALLPGSRANPYLVDRFEEPDENGSFHFIGVAPGGYVIAPVVRLANWELEDPAFRDSQRLQGISIELKPQETAHIDLLSPQ